MIVKLSIHPTILLAWIGEPLVIRIILKLIESLVLIVRSSIILVLIESLITHILFVGDKNKDIYIYICLLSFMDDQLPSLINPILA